MKWLKSRTMFKQINESTVNEIKLSYDDCVALCNKEESPFYETKTVVDGYPVSMFNYRLAQYSDFVNSDINTKEFRGLTFVFNTDGTLYKRYVLLEKFFNLNQTPESMYSVVKDYKIKFVNNKEDGSIASFVRLPNGKAVGKSKMGFDNDQANGINRIYKTDPDVKRIVDWALDNDIVAVFEYVAPHNRIVLQYPKEELILLRLRDNLTGRHLDLQDHMDIIGSMKIAPFEDDMGSLDNLIELVAKQENKEGCIVQCEDQNGNDVFFKLKTPWYCERHGLLTNDLYREHVLIGYILDDKIDDILGQIPEDEKEARIRIDKMVQVVKKAIKKKSDEIEKMYQVFVDMGSNRKEFAAKYLKAPNFAQALRIFKGENMKNMTQEEIHKAYGTIDEYEDELKKCTSYEMAKEWVKKETARLNIARQFLKERDPSLFFIDPEDEEDN